MSIGYFVHTSVICTCKLYRPHRIYDLNVYIFQKEIRIYWKVSH